MGNVPKIAMVGLGGIAQKVYLPILTRETDWELVGAYTPNASKRALICDQYRMTELASLDEVVATADAVFVHAATDSHYEVVSALLQAGKDVYVDKPLAATVEEAEQLVELAAARGRKLMVGFNRRFAPYYLELKQLSKDVSSIRVEKHRTDGIGPQDWMFTMLDDYLHLVDTARWLAGGNLSPVYHKVAINKEKHLVMAQHLFETDEKITIETAMHRKAGTDLEQVTVIEDGQLSRVKNMNEYETEGYGTIHVQKPGSWQNILYMRGFVDCVGDFIDCLQHDRMPVVDGLEALKTQQLLEELIRNRMG